MRQLIELYLNGQRVDLNDNGGIYLNYKQKEVKNPTIVKNMFSKSLSIPGTDINNQIFNNIWELTRVQTTDIVPYFNQSKRVDFQLYLNGELIEQGYCKLDSIKRNGPEITYQLSLYGGLGDFFYSLSYDTNTGTKKTLASLDFGQDLSFTINKETVKTAWDNLSAGTYNPITFATCYNGVPDNIDASKVLVNTSGFNGTIRVNQDGVWTDRTGFPTSKDGYTTVGGYGFAEGDELTEWDVRDLRSYAQRPVLHIPALFEAICNPENNGGYEVELDSDFFNDDNPYYKEAYITLPLINELDLNKIESSSEIDAEITDVEGSTFFNTLMNVSVTGEGDTYNMDLSLSGNADTTATTLYTSVQISNYLRTYVWQGLGVQLQGFDTNGNQVAGSNVWWLTSEIDGQYAKFENVTNGFNNSTFRFYDRVDTSLGTFVKTGNTFAWNGGTLNFKMPTNVDIASFKFKIVAGAYSNVSTFAVHRGKIWTTTSCREEDLFSKYVYLTFTGDVSNAEAGTQSNTVSFSNVEVSQASLLTTDYTPADYLLSYCKLFNLYFDKDVFGKKVSILCQKNFYNGSVDLTDDIHNVFEIKPLSFDHKWYSFNYAAGNGQLIKNYKAKYGTDYGQQRVNTGYEFDADTEDLLTNICYKNAVDVLEADKHYVDVTENNVKLPVFMLDNVAYKLFNGAGDSTEIELGISRNGSYTPINPISTSTIRYDAFNKVQFNDINKPTDGANVLLFFNGMKNNLVDYWITDDVAYMFQLNEKATWLWTSTEYDAGHNHIAIKTNSLPQFSRYIADNKNIYASWDFGRVKELYIPEISYLDADTTIYERYWRAYINDLYDVDTRIVTAYIKFDEKPTKNSLKHFYYFENSYWVIDEIIDYNPTSYDLTKVKFVKVNDPDNYLSQNIIPPTPGSKPLTFEILTGGTIVWKHSRVFFGSPLQTTISYSINGGAWTDITSTSAGTLFNVNAGDKVMFKGNNTTYASSTNSIYNTFCGSTAYFKAYGNIMSLFYGDDYKSNTEFESGAGIYGLFMNTNVVDAGGLELPATDLSNTQLRCYGSMFQGCTSLTTAPELPATILGGNCYVYMFAGCTSLATAPELPATTLTYGCYGVMFGGCTSLATAPVLPATTLEGGCYSNMFSGCSSLNYIKCDATDISASYCTNNWVAGVAETGTFVAPTSMYSTWTIGNNGIPEGWALTGITLTASWTTDISYTGGTASKDNCTYTVTAHYINGSTANVTTSSTITGTKSVAASTNTSRHTAGTLTLTATYKGYQGTADVTIYQAAAPYNLSITAATPIDATSTTLSYTVVASEACRVKLVGSTLAQDLYNDHQAGTTNGSFTIPANTESYEQYFTLTTWLTAHTSVTAGTSVEQLGASGPTLTGITLDNVTWATDVPATGGTATYQNCTYTVTAHYSDNTTADITSQAIMSASTSLNVPSTTSTTRESVGTINVIAFYYDGPNPFSTTVVVTAYQAAYVEPSPEKYVTLHLVYTGNTSTSFPVITAVVANVAPQSWTPTYVGETYDMVFSAGQVTDSTIMVTAVDQVPPYLDTITGELQGGSLSDSQSGTGQVGITMQINFSFGQSTTLQFNCNITGTENN